MILIPGIYKEEETGYFIYFIENLSEELKLEIRDKLAAICHGVDSDETSADIYSYKETAKEFVRRYKKNSSNARKKGMMGELLAHIILELEERYTVASPFFNMEERSFKKGFDISLYDNTNNELWISEVKSGSKQKGQANATSTAISLINTAQQDLKKRLNSENTSLWLNAINDAQVAMRDSNVQKEAIIRLLEECSNQSLAGAYSGKDQNVILIGVLFHPMKEHVIKEEIAKKYSQVIKEENFKQVIVIVIQEATVETIFDFLESESQG